MEDGCVDMKLSFTKVKNEVKGAYRREVDVGDVDGGGKGRGDGVGDEDGGGRHAGCDDAEMKLV
jgi:hypothetical protein